MKWLFISRILLLISFLTLYPYFSYADANDSLRSAIINGNIEEVKLFIGDGADVNKVYEDGSTPLLEAIDKSNGSSDIVNLLLQYGANPKLKPTGYSPLSAAKQKGNEEIIRLLRHYAEDEGEFYGLAVFYRDRKEDVSALEYVDKAVKLNPLNNDAWELKGSIYLSQKNIKEAEIAYHNAFRASLENLKTNQCAEGYTSALWYALLSADFTEALRLGKEGLSLFPESGSLEMNVGHALLFLGNKKEAVTFYKKALDDLKQSDKLGDQAGQLFSDDLSHLKERYPDKTALIGWAEKRLLYPFDFPIGEIPFGEEKNIVLNLVEGADVKKEPAVIEVLDPVLKKQLGEGLHGLDLKTQSSSTIVEKYSIANDKWDAVEHIDLFFIAPDDQDGRKILFLVSKVFKEQYGKIDALYGAIQDAVSKELSIQPAVHKTQIMSRFGSIQVPVKTAVWKSADLTVVLDVVSASSSSVKLRIIYVSETGWGKYLNTLRLKNKRQ